LFLDPSSPRLPVGEGAAVETQSVGVVPEEDLAVKGAGGSGVLFLQTFEDTNRYPRPPGSFFQG